MGFFTTYILSIVGIVLLGVIVDLILIDGQVKKYVKSIFVLFVIFTLVAPLPNLIDNIKKGEITMPSTDISIDNSYLDIILRQKNTAVVNAINRAMQENNIEGASISVEAKYEDNVYTILTIVVDLENIKYSVNHSKVVEIVQSVVDIDKEDIKIYE